MGLRAAVVAVLVLAFTAEAEDKPALKQALDKLQERYETTRTLTADFRQTVESPTLAKPL